MNIPIRYILSAIVTCLIVFTLTLSFTSEKEEVANAAPPLIIKLPEKESVIKEISYNDVLVESEKLHNKKQEKEWKELFKEVEKPKPEPVKKKVVVKKVDKVKEAKKKVVVKEKPRPKPEKEAPTWTTFEITAYTAYCEGCSGTTYTGIDLRANPGAKVVAVDPNVIPLGSTVKIKGYGTYLAADIGGAIKNHRIDLFIPSQEKALAFGRQNLEVQIIK